MARTKQTSRRSTGGLDAARRKKQLAASVGDIELKIKPRANAKYFVTVELQDEHDSDTSVLKTWSCMASSKEKAKQKFKAHLAKQFGIDSFEEFLAMVPGGSLQQKGMQWSYDSLTEVMTQEEYLASVLDNVEEV